MLIQLPMSTYTGCLATKMWTSRWLWSSENLSLTILGAPSFQKSDRQFSLLTLVTICCMAVVWSVITIPQTERESAEGLLEMGSCIIFKPKVVGGRHLGADDNGCQPVYLHHSKITWS